MQNFVEIGAPVWEKKIFEEFFTIYGHGGHLGQVTRTIYVYTGSPFLRILHIWLGFDWPSKAISEKRCLNITIINIQ